MSAGDTKIVLTGENTGLVIIDLNGNIVVSHANMPSKNSGDEILWDRTDDMVFWQSSGNVLQKCTVSSNNPGSTVSCTNSHTFTEYAGHGINSPDESSMTPNGWIYFVGQNTAGGTMDGFIYNPSTNTKDPRLTTTLPGHLMRRPPRCNPKNVHAPRGWRGTGGSDKFIGKCAVGPGT